MDVQIIMKFSCYSYNLRQLEERGGHTGSSVTTQSAHTSLQERTPLLKSSAGII